MGRNKSEQKANQKSDSKRWAFQLQILLPELLTLCLAVVGTAVLEGMRQTSIDTALSHVVLILLGFAVVGYAFRNALMRRQGSSSYGRDIPYTIRFWVCVWMGLLVAFACVFLPAGGYPFLAVFVMLALFSNTTVGILTGAMLVMIPVLITGGSIGVYVLYLVCGSFGAFLFEHLEHPGQQDKELRIAIPLFLAELSLLVCLTAQVVLLAKERLSLELFVIPAINLIVSGILLVGLMKVYSMLVLYRYREQYLELNDTENPILKSCRQERREVYFQGIHTAYFCERIAGKLELDADALKCAGYYHGMGEELTRLLEDEKLPPHAREILTEYRNRKKGITQKETAVLLYADAIVNAFLYLLKKEPEMVLQVEPVIDTIFKKIQEAGTMQECKITMQELTKMKRIFKEEKLYYDFLR